MRNRKVVFLQIHRIIYAKKSFFFYVHCTTKGTRDHNGWKSGWRKGIVASLQHTSMFMLKMSYTSCAKTEKVLVFVLLHDTRLSMSHLKGFSSL